MLRLTYITHLKVSNVTFLLPFLLVCKYIFYTHHPLSIKKQIKNHFLVTIDLLNIHRHNLRNFILEEKLWKPTSILKLRLETECVFVPLITAVFCHPWLLGKVSLYTYCYGNISLPSYLILSYILFVQTSKFELDWGRRELLFLTHVIWEKWFLFLSKCM